jgi:hypothetical protein
MEHSGKNREHSDNNREHSDNNREHSNNNSPELALELKALEDDHHEVQHHLTPTKPLIYTFNYELLCIQTWASD